MAEPLYKQIASDLQQKIQGGELAPGEQLPKEEALREPYPFRVTFTILPADRNQFVVNRGKVPEELAAPARDQ